MSITSTMGAMYAKHSSLQMSALSYSSKFVLPLLTSHIQQHTPQNGTIEIADIGCATGENSLQVILPMVDAAISTKSQQQCSVRFCDLEWNNWSKLFENVAKEQSFNSNKVFSSAVGKSFFKKLFPDNSMDIIFSSSAFHWLNSDVEERYRLALKRSEHPNIIYNALPDVEYQSFFNAHVQRDWKTIVDLRYAELKQGGLFACILFCSPTDSSIRKIFPDVPDTDAPRSALFEIMNRCALEMVRNKIIMQQEYDQFVIPMWPRTPDDHYVEMKKRFEIVHEESFEFNLPFAVFINQEPEKFARITSGFLRAFSESAFKSCLNTAERSEVQRQQLVNQFYEGIFGYLMSLDKEKLTAIGNENGRYYAIVGKKV